MLDIGPKSPFFQVNFTTFRMCAKQAASCFCCFGKHINCAVNANLQYVIIFEASKFTLIFKVWPKPAKACLDHLSCLRMRANVTRQRQQSKCVGKVNRGNIGPPGNRCPFWFFYISITELNIKAIRPAFQEYWHICSCVGAK